MPKGKSIMRILRMLQIQKIFSENGMAIGNGEC